MALYNRVVGELNLGSTSINRYGYLPSIKETAAVSDAVGKGFLQEFAEPNLNTTANAVTVEEIGLLNASLPVPMAFMSALTLGGTVLVGFGKTGMLSAPVFVNQLYSFDGMAFMTKLTLSTEVLDSPGLYGASVSQVGVLS